MRFYRCVVLLLFTVSTQAAEIKGKVTNAAGGEALERVQVVVLETKSSATTTLGGEFSIPKLPPGQYTMRLNAVGYRLLTVPFSLSADSDIKEFSITMVPDNFRHTDKIEVRGDLFQVDDSRATTEINLTSSEIRQASTVFADDPFRAVQTLPGVSAEGNNEFFAEFSVMGAPFANVAVYMDDVLVLNPFHEIGNFSEGASLGVLTSEVVEEMKVLPAAYSEKFGDADGAALDIHTRDGSRGSPLFRISAGIAASEILGEGGIGSSRKGSWLASARKSYINYLVHNRVEDAADVSFGDLSLKLMYDITPKQNISLFATGGHTSMEMTDPATLVNYQYANGDSDFTFARAGWRWSPTPRVLVDARAAYIREPDQLFNNENVLLTKTDHREWVGGGGVSFAWAPDHVLQAGWSARKMRDSEYQSGFTDSGELQAYSFSGSDLRQSAFVQQASSFLQGRIHAVGSLRWDRFQNYLPQRFSPQLSMAVRVAHATELQFGAGSYAQFTNSALGPAPGLCLPFGTLPQKSEHYHAAVEQRLGENTRIRLEAFQRKNFLTLGATPPERVVSDSCPVLQASLGGTYQSDYSQGVQLVLQRRSANRLSGWIGYTLLKAEQRQYQINDPYPPFALFANSGYYPTLEDQRHTLNLFAMYRVRPDLSLSSKFLFGSGFPVPGGTYVRLDNGQFIETGLNGTHLGDYLRLDVRADKDWAFHHWKLTLYGEVLNVTNHYNSRFAYESGVDPSTGQILIKTLRGLPILPTVGLVFQF